MGASNSLAPTRPSVPWPLALLGPPQPGGRSLRLQIAGQGRPQQSRVSASWPGGAAPRSSSSAHSPRSLGTLNPFLRGETRGHCLATQSRMGEMGSHIFLLTQEAGTGKALLSQALSPSHNPSTSREAPRPLPWPSSRRLQSRLLAWWFPGREPGRERASAASSVGRGQRWQQGTLERVGGSPPCGTCPAGQGLLGRNTPAAPGPAPGCVASWGVGGKNQQVPGGLGAGGGGEVSPTHVSVQLEHPCNPPPTMQIPRLPARWAAKARRLLRAGATPAQPPRRNSPLLWRASRLPGSGVTPRCGRLCS